jgi:hypothetical protein
MKAIEIKDKSILALLREEAAKSVEATYEPDASFKPVSIDEFEVKTITGAYGPFTKVSFSVKGEAEPMSLRVKGNKAVDADQAVRIVLYKAKRDFTCTNGKVIKAGTKALMVTQ